MRVTNRRNLPEQFVRAAAASMRKPVPGRFGVTRLLDAPQVLRILTDRWDDIEVDASEFVWSIMGSAVHRVLEAYSGESDLAEEKLTVEFSYHNQPITIVGIPDVYDGLSCSVEDWKFTSTWAYVYGIHEEWKAQLNVNAWLLRKHEVPVRELAIFLIFRDWSRMKALRGGDYPQSDTVKVPVEDWGFYKTEQYISERLQKHLEAPESLCSDAERWYRGETWAVMKKGRVRALRLLETEEKAHTWIESQVKPKDLKEIEVVKRPGRYARCEDYCIVRSVCPQWAATDKTQGEGGEEDA